MQIFQKALFKLKLRTFKKVSFGLWARLEDLRRSWIKAVEEGRDDFIGLMGEYISTAFSFSFNVDNLYWEDALLSIYKIHHVISEGINPIPIISRSEGTDKEDDPWNYNGRLWYFYSHTLASAYGWTKGEISNLSVNDGLAYVQEIFTDEYQQREFVWSTTEVAYSVDKHTKKTKYNSLPKPYWMKPVFKEIRREVPKVPAHLLPVGLVIDLNEEAKKNKQGV